MSYLPDELSAESQQIINLMALSTAITCAETAAEELYQGGFDDEDMQTLAALPAELRLPILTRLVEVAEQLREGLRLVDEVILVASGSQAITTA
jgi:hypothetical protein